jgi:DNA uptake protein ComE-like DNA-binding protein
LDVKWGFKSVGEIKLVLGIGDKMFEKIRNEVQL